MAIKTETFTVGGGGGGGAVDSVNGDTGNVIVTLDGVTDQNAVTTNSVTVGGVTVGTEYSLPTADGTVGQAITTDGNGALSFSTVSSAVTSVNTLTGAVVVSGDDIAADHTASNYTAANANIDGHLSGIDTKFGTLGTASVEDVGTTAGDLVQLDGAAKLPAIDGSQLTNLPSTALILFFVEDVKNDWIP